MGFKKKTKILFILKTKVGRGRDAYQNVELRAHRPTKTVPSIICHTTHTTYLFFYRVAWNADAVYDLTTVKLVIVTKRKNAVTIFLFHIKRHLSYICDKTNGWWGVTPST